MHAHTLAMNLSRGSIEVLELQLTQVAAVDGVSPFAAKFLHIEVMGAHADFLIGIECHANLSVFNLLMVAQEAHGLHNLGDAGLVVGAKQRGAIGDDKVFAYVLQQFGELLRTADDAFREKDVAAIVVLDDASLDVGTRAVGAGVVV